MKLAWYGAGMDEAGVMTGPRWFGLSISSFYSAQWLFYVFSYSMVTYTLRLLHVLLS